MTEGSFSMAMMVDHCSEIANAITFPPAPANISINMVFEAGVKARRSSATLLFLVRWLIERGGEKSVLCNGFRRDSEPRIVGHVDTFLVQRPNTVALLPVSHRMLEIIFMMDGEGRLTSEYPRPHLHDECSDDIRQLTGTSLAHHPLWHL